MIKNLKGINKRVKACGLDLVEAQEDHFQEYFNVWIHRANRHLIAEYTQDDLMRGLDDMKNVFLRLIKNNSVKLYMIKHRNGIIGYAIIQKIDFVNKNCEFGIILKKNYDKHGFGLYVFVMLCHKIFADIKLCELRNMYAVINEDNKIALKQFEKYKLVIGKIRNLYYVNKKLKSGIVVLIPKKIFGSICEG